jgi:hypothetical protein
VTYATAPQKLLSVEEIEARLRAQPGLFADANGEGAANPVEEHILRAVLRSWDFRDPAGWRAILERSAPRDLHGPLSEVLTRVAGSEIRTRLVAGSGWQREVEFVFRVGEANGVTGRIDCLWQTKDGWHILLYGFERYQAIHRQARWQERLPGLVLAAESLYQQTGARARTVCLALVREGLVISRAGSRLPHRSTLQRVVKTVFNPS